MIWLPAGPFRRASNKPPRGSAVATLRCTGLRHAQESPKRSEERRVGSEWSSDVCSSDLHDLAACRAIPSRVEQASTWIRGRHVEVHGPQACAGITEEIGRAACRE